MRTAAPIVAVLAILAISGALVAAAIAGADHVELRPSYFSPRSPPPPGSASGGRSRSRVSAWACDTCCSARCRLAS